MNLNELRQIVDYMGQLQELLNTTQASGNALSENQVNVVNETISTLNQTGIFLYDYKGYFEVKLQHLLEQKLSPIITDEDLQEAKNGAQDDFDDEWDDEDEEIFEDDHSNGEVFVRSLDEDEAALVGSNYEVMCYSSKHGPVKLFNFAGPENMASEDFKNFKINLLECGALKSNAVSPSIIQAEQVFRGIQDFLWNAIEREQMDYLQHLKTNLAFNLLSKKDENVVNDLEKEIRFQEDFLGLEPESFQDMYNNYNPDQEIINIHDGIAWPPSNDDEKEC